MNKAWIGMLVAMTCLAQSAWAASLTSTDTDLGRISAGTIKDGIDISVDLGDDVPVATHVIARFQNNQPLMLGRDGLWAPWGGDLTHLDEVTPVIADKNLTFHILDTLPDSLFYPVSITVVYRTDTEVKSGTLTVDGP